MKKYSKRDYCEVFNALLGTNIDWTKLSKEELVQLAMIFNNPEVLLSKLGIKIDKRMVRDRIVDGMLQLMDKMKLEGPIANFLKNLLKPNHGLKEESKE